MRSLIQTKRRHFHNSKASLMNYFSQEAPKQGEILINQGTAAMVQDLGEAQQELEVSGHHFGQFSTTIVIYSQDLREVRRPPLSATRPLQPKVRTSRKRHTTCSIRFLRSCRAIPRITSAGCGCRAQTRPIYHSFLLPPVANSATAF